jgi:Zn-dependent peptidase ImmA (M78 family)
MTLAQARRLEFDFTPGNHDAALGFGSLRVSIGNSSVWSNEEGKGIPWTWIDLLEQLARAWPFLKYEESAPLGTNGLALLRADRFASPDFDFEPAVQATRESYIFLRRHNLATGIEGLYLPNFSLLREGRNIWVISANITKLLDFAQTLQTLSELGEVLARQVASAAQQERSRLALDAWRNREPSLEAALQIKLGSSRLAAEMVPQGETLAAYFDALPDAQNDDEYESSLLVAARMSEGVPLDSRRKILDLLRARPGTRLSAQLQQIAAEAETKLPSYYSQQPYKQGESLAQWARARFDIAPEAKADPQEVLGRLGVDVTLHHFDIDMIDAVGCWDHRHGPAVLVNLDGEHAQSAAGRRATLAHELAHVLVDRRGSLPAAEVFGGSVPRHPEQRANAFAAEFLLPKSVAVERIRKASDVVKTIERLPEQFAVSRELAAWQIINSRIYAELSNDAKALLKSWTPNNDNTWFFR